MKAVIDCGTNTFNLLTGKKESNGKLFVAHEASRSVKLRLEQFPMAAWLHKLSKEVWTH